MAELIPSTFIRSTSSACSTAVTHQLTTRMPADLTYVGGVLPPMFLHDGLQLVQESVHGS